MSAHEDIRIPFKISGRGYEAVGFLKEDEPDIDGQFALHRVEHRYGGVIGKEDEGFILKNFDNLPAELQRYYLATNRPDTDSFITHRSDRAVSFFEFSLNRRQWDRHWLSLDQKWWDEILVVRRCS